MTLHFRLMPSFAVAVCVAAAIGCAAPANAAEERAGIKASSANSSDVRTSPSVTKHHAWRRARYFAASRYSRRVNLAGTNPTCSGVWCGRQFVLMIGIGF